MPRRRLLDETVRWRDRQSTAPWTLGEALCVVGPPWWPLLRRGYATIVEMGGRVTGVKQRAGLLVVHVRHDDHALWSAAQAASLALTEASRTICEGCGARVPPPPADARRNHCVECVARLQELACEYGIDAERRLWMERSGVWLPERRW